MSEAGKDSFRSGRQAGGQGTERQKTGPPQRIGDVLAGLLARRGYARVLAASQLEAAWKEAAGEPLAGQSRPGAVRAGVLEVLVRNSAVVQELTFQKRRLLGRLKELAPGEKIKELRFRVGAWD